MSTAVLTLALTSSAHTPTYRAPTPRLAARWSQGEALRLVCLPVSRPAPAAPEDGR